MSKVQTPCVCVCVCARVCFPAGMPCTFQAGNQRACVIGVREPADAAASVHLLCPGCLSQVSSAYLFSSSFPFA